MQSRVSSTRRGVSRHVSLYHLPLQCGGRWAAHERQTDAIRRAPRRQSRWRTMLLSSISISGHQQPCPRSFRALAMPLQKILHGWWVRVAETTSTAAFTMLGIGTAYTTMYCGRSRAFVTTQVSPPTSRWCSRVRTNRRADLGFLNIRVIWQTDLLVDVTLGHDFIGDGRDGGRTHGKLRKPDNPDQILESAAAQKIRNYANPFRRNRLGSTLRVSRVHEEEELLHRLVTRTGGPQWRVHSLLFKAKAVNAGVGD